MENKRFTQIFTAAFLAAVLSVAFISCAGGKNSAKNIGDSNPETVVNKPAAVDYSGTYKLSGEDACSIVITIKRDNDGYAYSIAGDSVKSSGKISVSVDGETVYLLFRDTRRSGDSSEIEGVYSGERIVMQNYGNSLNSYILFQECDAKYLEFERNR